MPGLALDLKTQSQIDSHLFFLRLWTGPADTGEVMWEGKVQHIMSGQVASFCDWPSLVAALLTMLPQDGETQQDKGNEDGRG